jgi:hypothetical protein
VDCLRPIRSSLERKAARRQRTIEFCIPPELPEVYCDQNQIGRVVQTLATTMLLWDSRSPVRVSADPLPARHELRISVSCDDGGETAGSDKRLSKNLRLIRTIVRRNLGRLDLKTVDGGSEWSIRLSTLNPPAVAKRYFEEIVGWPRSRTAVSLATVQCPTAVDPSLSRDIGNLLRLVLRPVDLLLPTNEMSWLVACRGDDPGMSGFKSRMEETRATFNRKRLRCPLPDLLLNPMGTWRADDRLTVLLHCLSRL